MLRKSAKFASKCKVTWTNLPLFAPLKAISLSFDTRWKTETKSSILRDFSLISKGRMVLLGFELCSFAWVQTEFCVFVPIKSTNLYFSIASLEVLCYNILANPALRKSLLLKTRKMEIVL